ncbi:MAG: hypothetical protein LWX07_02085 [Bacteroidetes bacterium]|nr:hypothetical protein [Bacteroidota bacterium]
MKIGAIILLFVLLTVENLFSQGGGPPMLTTDPGTPGNNHWEINTSLGCHFPTHAYIQVPTIEIVYGIGNHYQVSAQLPLPSVELNKSHFTVLTQPQTGVKCQFLDEEKNFISLAVYPQIIIPIHKEEKSQIFIPLEFEKTFNNFRVGEEFGYFVLNNPNTFFNGTLIGFRFKNELELMGEFYLSKTLNETQSASGILNIGLRKQFSKNLVLMSSIGTEVIAPFDEDKESLFGLVGVQILFGN